MRLSINDSYKRRVCTVKRALPRVAVARVSTVETENLMPTQKSRARAATEDETCTPEPPMSMHARTLVLHYACLCHNTKAPCQESTPNHLNMAQSASRNPSPTRIEEHGAERFERSDFRAKLTREFVLNAIDAKAASLPTLKLSEDRGEPTTLSTRGRRAWDRRAFSGNERCPCKANAR